MTIAAALNELGGLQQLRRGRRGPQPERRPGAAVGPVLGEDAGRAGRASGDLRPRRRPAQEPVPQPHPPGGERAVRRGRRVPDELGRDPDQDGPGGEARRGRPAHGQEGDQGDRRDPLRQAGQRPDQPAAAPRHLLDRGPGPAHLRPEGDQAGRAGVGQAGGGREHRDDRRRGGQGRGRRDRDRRHRRRDRGGHALQQGARRPAERDGAGRGAPGAGDQRAAHQGTIAGRGRDQERLRRGQVRPVRGRAV